MFGLVLDLQLSVFSSEAVFSDSDDAFTDPCQSDSPQVDVVFASSAAANNGVLLLLLCIMELREAAERSHSRWLDGEFVFFLKLF